MLKRLPAVLHCERLGFDPWVGKTPWRRKWLPTLVLLPRESHGWRRLVGYSPWGGKESDMTEQLHYFHQSTPLVLEAELTFHLKKIKNIHKF